MVDLDTAIADLQSAISSAATRITAAMSALTSEISALQGQASADTTAAQTAAAAVEAEVANLAALAPAPDPAPEPGPDPVVDPVPARDPITNKVMYTLDDPSATPDLSVWVPVTDVTGANDQALYTFMADLGGGPATGAGNSWTVYTGTPVPVAAPVVASSLGVGEGQQISGSVGVPLIATIAAEGGTGPYTFTVGGLPLGLLADAEGNLSGTPASSGMSSVSVEVTDSTGETANGSVTITIA